MKTKTLKQILYLCLIFAILLTATCVTKNPFHADEIPTISVDFDPSDQSVIVSGIPAYDSTGAIHYELRGSLKYGDERIETFCYAPHAMPYHIPEKQAYVFNWADAEFLLPCSGEYTFTAYVSALSPSTGNRVDGPKTSITITLTKQDESTNWGPGLPNTTVEAYDLNQMKGKDKNIVIEEEGYTWTINGQDIITPPEENLSLAITVNPDDFQTDGVDEFFGDTIASKFSIEHNGEFGFTATLDYSLGAEYIGKYANLFYVVGDGTFEFMKGALVDENGSVSYSFTHASDYVIAITDEEYTGQELNPKPEEPVVDTETEADTNIQQTDDDTTVTNTDKENNSDSPNTMTFLLIVIVVVLVVGFVALFIKKRQ